MSGLSTIAIPLSLDKKFKFKNLVREAAQNLNAQLEGLKFVEIQDEPGFNPFQYGLIFISDQKECFWTVGKTPGFEGLSRFSIR